MSKLFIVGTPIGNLSDISKRAIQTLSEVDFIIAEDTRITGKLLSHLGIKKPLISSHKYSENDKASDIVHRIIDGETAALVTDAGMPCISDPGEIIVSTCAEFGIEVLAIPGPVACVTALALSGISSKKFIFEGFLPQNKKHRRERLRQLSSLEFTLIFYESPHRILECLSDILDIMGNRKASISREITKIYEQTIRGEVEFLRKHFTINEPRGEFVIVLEGGNSSDGIILDIDEVVKQVLKLSEKGIKLSEACKIYSKKSSFSKSDIYNHIISLNTD